MKRIAAAALAVVAIGLASLGHVPHARAQALTGYMTVDEIEVRGGGVTVTGVVQGDAVASTLSFHGVGDATLRAAALEQCHRMLLLALSKPGQYLAFVRAERCTVALVKP